MSRSRPIGIFDSGVGGLSVVAEVRRLLPHESILYYADTLNCPYGPRSPEEIRRLATDASRFLLDQGAKLIVVACNTASSVALASLRGAFTVPFVGMVPAVKPASLSTRARKVLVMATAATVQAEVFNELVEQFARDIEVHKQACPGLVDLVEACEMDLEASEVLLHQYLEPVRRCGIDTIVLGCTHFVFLRDAIQRLAGDTVRVIDTGEAVARQVRRVLRDRNLEAAHDAAGSLTILSSANHEQFAATARRLLEGLGSRVQGPG